MEREAIRRLAFHARHATTATGKSNGTSGSCQTSSPSMSTLSSPASRRSSRSYQTLGESTELRRTSCSPTTRHRTQQPFTLCTDRYIGACIRDRTGDRTTRIRKGQDLVRVEGVPGSLADEESVEARAALAVQAHLLPRFVVAQEHKGRVRAPEILKQHPRLDCKVAP
eukprot:2615149-Rhodomonas_salina.1